MVYALHMLDDSDVEALTSHKENVANKEAALELAKTERDNHVRDLLASGAMPTEIARVAGLSRERIYQIKQRRR